MKWVLAALFIAIAKPSYALSVNELVKLAPDRFIPILYLPVCNYPTYLQTPETIDKTYTCQLFGYRGQSDVYMALVELGDGADDEIIQLFRCTSEPQSCSPVDTVITGDAI